MKPIQESQEFDAVEPLQALPEEAEESLDSALLSTEPPRPARVGVWTKVWLGAGLALVLAEAGLTLQASWQTSPWLFALYALFFSLALAGLVRLTVKEWVRLRQLRGRANLQEQLQPLLSSQQMGAAAPLLDQLRLALPSQCDDNWRQWQSRVQDHHSDAELLALAESTVVAPLDKQAEAIIYRYSAQAAVMLAASPLAVLDMALMLWRNQRMLDELAKLYGVEPGYLGRVSLVRQMLHNLIYAGGSELMVDLGGQMLSAELTGKLSARLAQGMGAGLLTARLGYQAQKLCRPLPLTEARPRLLTLQGKLLSELTSLSAKALRQARERQSCNK
ncbi:YcjF family protein [Ferrimonas sp. SCSIO 43195]|uniref:YcjF family protein n=1 Tax=Ferrimonas sp. SCSIO 43195 TaxID=2822844 RepID=UPI00207656E3|nr:TIGR01620 family protein [Ferrimonas sp. SCSIO 43195]USD38569.1 TIGR01620 family protein [Ferrimonas sp. SCSIO 43195]